MAEVINSGKVIDRSKIVLERDDFLPPGLVGVRSKTAAEAGEPKLDAGDSQDNQLIVIDGDPDDPAKPKDPEDPFGFGIELPVPQDMRIISQTMRIAEDKSVKIDVLIETSDIPGIKEFEARVKNDGVLPPGYVPPERKV